MSKKQNHKNKNDHITIPESTLKLFVPEGSFKFSFLDLKSMEIIEKGASQYHKECNYFPKAFDKSCQSFETGIGNLRAKIGDAEKQGLNLTYNVSILTENVKQLIFLHTAREPETLNFVMEKEHGEKLINDMKSFITMQGMLNAKTAKAIDDSRKIFASGKTKREYFYDDNLFRIQCDSFMEKVKNYKATIVRIPQNISATFLLTPFHFTQVGNVFHFVLSPRHAICLYPSKMYDGLFNSGGIIYDIEDAESVESIYRHDIKMVKQAKNQHLIGEKHILEKILQIKSNMIEGERV